MNFCFSLRAANASHPASLYELPILHKLVAPATSALLLFVLPRVVSAITPRQPYCIPGFGLINDIYMRLSNLNVNVCKILRGCQVLVLISTI